MLVELWELVQVILKPLDVCKLLEIVEDTVGLLLVLVDWKLYLVELDCLLRWVLIAPL